MDGTRVNQAVSRIEAALSRIERVAANTGASTRNDPDLERRYTALRQSVRDSLDELDSVIAKLEK